jgi:hypothetical protein
MLPTMGSVYSSFGPAPMMPLPPQIAIAPRTPMGPPPSTTMMPVPPNAMLAPAVQVPGMPRYGLATPGSQVHTIGPTGTGTATGMEGGGGTAGYSSSGVFMGPSVAPSGLGSMCMHSVCNGMASSTMTSLTHASMLPGGGAMGMGAMVIGTPVATNGGGGMQGGGGGAQLNNISSKGGESRSRRTRRGRGRG